MTALVAGLVVGVFAPEPSFAEPAPAHVYTPGDGGPRVSAVPLGGGAGGRVPWKFTVAFRRGPDGRRVTSHAHASRKSPAGCPRPTRRPGGGAAHGRCIGSLPDGSDRLIAAPRY